MRYFHQPKKHNPNINQAEHPSISHWNVSHSHGDGRTNWSMTQNDYRGFTFKNSGMPSTSAKKEVNYQGSLAKESYKKALFGSNFSSDVNKVVAQGRFRQSSSIPDTDLKKIAVTKRQEPARTRQDLLKSDIGFDKFGHPSVKQSHYSNFCDSLQEPRSFPHLYPNSRPREFNIITNVTRQDQGLKHYGYEHYDQNKKGGNHHHIKSSDSTQVPPTKQRFFLY